MRSVISLSLPEKMAKELGDFAIETGRNKSDIVKESLSIYLWGERFKKSRRHLGAKAAKMGLVTDEDVFKAVS
jgi:metal-responsive CopG/Arc/MetJ family transcriptional regulator